MVKPGIKAINFDEKSILNSILGFNPQLDYKHLYVYTSQKDVSLSAIDKNNSSCVIFDGSVLHGLREPILYSFILEKPSGYKVFCQPKTIH